MVSRGQARVCQPVEREGEGGTGAGDWPPVIGGRSTIPSRRFAVSTRIAELSAPRGCLNRLDRRPSSHLGVRLRLRCSFQTPLAQAPMLLATSHA